MSAIKEFAKLLKEAQEQQKEAKALDNFAKILKETKLSSSKIEEPSIIAQSASVLEETPIPTEVVLEEKLITEIEQSIDPIERVASTISAKTNGIETERWNDPLRRNPSEKFVTFKEMNDHYSNFLNRIQQQMSTIGGGGEVKFARLDDINTSGAGYNKHLTYDQNTRKFYFDTIKTGEGIQLDANNQVSLSVATETTLGGIKLGPGVELNGLDQIVIDSTGLDFSFGDFFAYTANGAAATPAAYLSSINDNQDIVIQSNGTGQIDIIGKFGIFPVDGPLNTRDPVFAVNDDGDVSATTLNIINRDDLGLVAPLNVTINEQGLTRTPAVVTGSVAQFTGRDNRSSIIVLDTYGVDTTRNITGGEFVFRSGRGTNETPSPILANDIIGNVTAAGWAAANGYGGVGVGGLRIVADENFTSTSRGSRVEIYTTPMGSITPTRIVTIDDSGLVFNENDNTGIKNVDYVTFDPNHVDTANTEGVIAWNSDDGTLNIHHQGGVTQQVGQELYAKVRNRTGSTILNGSVVRFSGAEMDGSARLLVAPFLGNGEFPSLYGLGVATQDIGDGDDGLVTVWGKVRDLDTSTWNIGDILYVSPSTAGQLTNVKPTAPNNVIPIAAVLRKDSTAGEIFVRPTIEQRQYYGRFARTTTQTANTENTGYPIIFDDTEISNGIAIGSPASRIVVSDSGFYQFDVSLQVEATSNKGTVYIWFRKNNNDVPNSSRSNTITNGDLFTISTSLQISLNTNEWVEVVWAADASGIQLRGDPSPAIGPSVASVLLSVAQIQL